MAVSYLIVSTAPEKEYDVAKWLREQKSTVQVDRLIGEYDIIAKVETPTLNDLTIYQAALKRVKGVIEAIPLTAEEFAH